MASAASDTNRRAWVGEHDTIYGMLTRISKAVARFEAKSTSDRRRRKTLAELAALRQKLERHFAREEDDGLFDVLADMMPDAAWALERLRIEHGEIRGHLDAIARTLEAGVFDVERLTAEIEELVDLLYAHETMEEQLTSRALDWKVPNR